MTTLAQIEALSSPLAGGVRTPASIRSKIAQVNGDVATFTYDVAHSAAPEPWKTAYATWLGSWTSFYNDTYDSLWSQLWGDTYTQAERFEMRLSDWRAALVTMGGATTAPPPRPEQLEETDWGTVLIWTGVLAAVGAGLWFGWPYIAARFAASRQQMAGLEEDCGCGG